MEPRFAKNTCDLLELRAEWCPTWEPLFCDSIAINARVMFGRAEAFSNGLSQSVPESGRPIALLFHPRNWIPFAVSYFGVQMAGLIPVPIEPSNPLLHDFLEHLDAAACVSDGWTRTEVRLSQPLLNFHELLVEGSAAQPPDRKWPLPTDIAHISYTSGTSARPRAVATKHEGVVAADFDEVFKQSCTNDVHLLTRPTFNGGLDAMLMSLIEGHPLGLIGKPTFNHLRSALEEWRVNRVFFWPADADTITRQWEWSDSEIRFPQVREVSLAGARSSVSVINRLERLFPNASIFILYGQTEAGGAMTIMEVDKSRIDCVGRVGPKTEVMIANDVGRALETHEIGEIYLKRTNDIPMPRYWSDPRGNELKYRRGWVLTGDKGYLDEDGYLYLVERIRETIQRGPNVVYPSEVEAVLVEHKDVIDAVVFGMPDEDLGEEIAAGVMTAGNSPDASWLHDYLLGRLDAHKIPRHFFQRSSFPRTGSGKVIRHKLREEILASTRKTSGLEQYPPTKQSPGYPNEATANFAMAAGASGLVVRTTLRTAMSSVDWVAFSGRSSRRKVRPWLSRNMTRLALPDPIPEHGFATERESLDWARSIWGLEILNPRPGTSVLVVDDPWNGYATALVHVIVGSAGNCTLLAARKELSTARKALGRFKSREVRFVRKRTDGAFLGEGQFDAILLGGEVTSIPSALLNRLKVGGRLVATVTHAGSALTLRLERVEQTTFKGQPFMWQPRPLQSGSVTVDGRNRPKAFDIDPSQFLGLKGTRGSELTLVALDARIPLNRQKDFAFFCCSSSISSSSATTWKWGELTVVHLRLGDTSLFLIPEKRIVSGTRSALVHLESLVNAWIVGGQRRIRDYVVEVSKSEVGYSISNLKP